MKRKSLLKTIHYGGYPAYLILACGVSDAALKRSMRAKGVNEEPSSIDLDAVTTFYPPLVVVLRMKVVPSDSNAMGLLSHELWHAVKYVLQHLGIKPSDETEEAYAYAIQDLTQRCLLALVG